MLEVEVGLSPSLRWPRERNIRGMMVAARDKWPFLFSRFCTIRSAVGLRPRIGDATTSEADFALGE